MASISTNLGVSEVVELLDAREHGGRRPRLRRPQPRRRPGHPFLRALPQGIRRARSACSAASSTPRSQSSPTSSAASTNSCKPSLAWKTVLPIRPTWGEMARKTRGPDNPRRDLAQTNRSSKSSILPPAPPHSSSKSSTLSTRTLTAKWKQQRLTDAQQTRGLEQVRAEAPSPALARLRADDGSLCHRPHENRPQALRNRIPFRQRRACAHLPHQCPGTAER